MRFYHFLLICLIWLKKFNFIIALLFASGSTNNLISIWNENGLVKTISTSHPTGIYSIEQIKENTIVTGGRDSFQVFNYMNNSMLSNIASSDGDIYFARLINETHFVVADRRELYVYSTENYAQRKSIGSHNDDINGLGIFTISKRLVSSDAGDSLVKIRNIDSGSTIQQININVKNIEVLNNDNLAIARSDSNSITIYNSIYQVIQTLNIGSSVSAMKFLTNTYLACGTTTGLLIIYDTSTWSVIKNQAAHIGTIKAIEELSTNLLATGSSDKSIKIWDISTWNLFRFFNDTAGIQTLKSLIETIVISTTETQTTTRSTETQTTATITETQTTATSTETQTTSTLTQTTATITETQTTATSTETQTTATSTETQTTTTSKFVDSLTTANLPYFEKRIIGRFFLIRPKEYISFVHDSFLITSMVEKNNFKCIEMCSRDLNCRYVVFEIDIKLCKLYKELTEPFIFIFSANSNTYLRL
ncbi:unnamed protein product [Brachionus calyciflorus]|uniref:Uncharacterized protein n=1 Tax=Brachionus calyciflorus TaxID=104777 RepID=A0A813VAC6_9BILA|nr:unnamed protein product [Brachionus calyciflorus]